MCACSKPRIDCDQRELHVERQRGGDAVRIDLERVQPFGLEEDLVRALRRRSAPPCPRSTGSSAGRRPRSAPVYSGERSSAPRMISWVRSLVWVIQQGTWRGCSSREPRNENTGAGSSPGCCSRPREVDACGRRCAAACRSSGGRRRTGSSRSRCASARRRRIARAAARVLRQADVDLAGEERAGGQHHRARAERQPHLGDHAARRGRPR